MRKLLILILIITLSSTLLLSACAPQSAEASDDASASQDDGIFSDNSVGENNSNELPPEQSEDESQVQDELLSEYCDGNVQLHKIGAERILFSSDISLLTLQGDTEIESIAMSDSGSKMLISFTSQSVEIEFLQNDKLYKTVKSTACVLIGTDGTIYTEPKVYAEIAFLGTKYCVAREHYGKQRFIDLEGNPVGKDITGVNECVNNPGVYEGSYADGGSFAFTFDENGEFKEISYIYGDDAMQNNKPIINAMSKAIDAFFDGVIKKDRKVLVKVWGEELTDSALKLCGTDIDPFADDVSKAERYAWVIDNLERCKKECSTFLYTEDVHPQNDLFTDATICLGNSQFIDFVFKLKYQDDAFEVVSASFSIDS